MESQEKERWRQLCEQATQERDPQRLLELVQEINILLVEDEEKKKVHADGSAHAKSA